MEKEVVFCDLDGTLSKFPGHDFRSLYSKVIDFNSVRFGGTGGPEESISTNEEAAKKSAELMVNRYTSEEIETLKGNIKRLYLKFEKIMILSHNFKLVSLRYLQELDVMMYFDISSSYFREDMSDHPHKKDVWSEIACKHSSIICIDDDDEVLDVLRKMDSRTKFVHVDRWLGDPSLNINSLLKGPPKVPEPSEPPESENPEDSEV
jgi:hypothetical protein